MKLDVQLILTDLKAQGLPLAEKALIAVIDTVLKNVASQCASQATGSMVAAALALGIPALQPAIDAELAKVLPDAAK